MHRITRSQYHLDVIKSFLKSDKPKIYLNLYPREVDSLQTRYNQELNFTMLSKVMAYKDDQRYHCLVQKKDN